MTSVVVASADHRSAEARPAPKAVVVAGATGLVGRAVLDELATRDGITAYALVRRQGAVPKREHLKEVLFDFEDEKAYHRVSAGLPCDVLLCCLGTTIRKAGSEAAFRRVDHDYPLSLLHALQVRGSGVFGFISSVGADDPTGFYLTVKHEVEEVVRGSGVPHVVVRPSILMGERAERRPVERLGVAVARPLRAFTGGDGLLGRFANKYAPVEAAEVARALVHHTLEAPPGPEGRVVEGAAVRRA